jgi:hypothetical protein
MRALLAFLSVFLIATSANAQPAFSDARVQSPELKAPERGSLAGALAGVAFGPADVSRGAFSLPSPFSVPKERGEVLVSPFPAYSPENGLSEWGMGFQASLAIVRSRMTGDLDYETDERSGPWGRMQRGTDGAFYPVGLRTPVRVDEVGTSLVAYLPNGDTWTFGGDARVVTSRGTYAWNVTDVTSAAGWHTRFTYAKNESGKLFLSSVSYGAEKAPYTIAFDYEKLAQQITDYRSGIPLVLDRRVKTVRVTLPSNVERYRYTLDYTASSQGVGFYLTSVAQRFASGESAPPVTYTYRDATTVLDSAQPRRNPKLDSLVNGTDSDVVQPNRATWFDLNDDGLPDIERASDFKAFVQTADTFAERDLAAPSSSIIDDRCRPAPAAWNAPRQLARMRANDALPSVVVLTADPSHLKTSAVVCSREGATLFDSVVLGDWEAESGAKLVDLNHDHQPDLVRIGEGIVETLPNTSTPTEYRFGAPKASALSPSFTPQGTWVEDINGDTMPDLVARTDSELVVWFGKGQFEFEPTGQSFEFFTGSGQLAGLASFEQFFVDANKDGLADVLLGKSGELSLFINTGSAFRLVDVPGLNGIRNRPIPFDAAGTGNTELTFMVGDEAYSLALDDASSGLLVAADDGKGTVLRFAYARATPAADLRARQTRK